MKKTVVITRLVMFLICFQHLVFAEIIIGPWVFEDAAFADEAIQLESGRVDLYNATDLQSALCGFSPNTAITNIGFEDRANLFEIRFTDLLMINQAGDDLVLFEFAAYNHDDYEISFHTASGYTPYRKVSGYISLGNIGPSGSELYGMGIDLSDHGLNEGLIVDSFRFRGILKSTIIEPDPVMFGALNTIPEPTTLLLLGMGAVLMRKGK
ncbi:MAG: PEP-CTERM sorting domain-containing protein [Planctomycetota bacterium]